MIQWIKSPTNDIQALEQKRAKVARQRHIWIVHRQPFMAHMLERIGFLDETWLKTNMAKTTGWAPRGQRLKRFDLNLIHHLRRNARNISALRCVSRQAVIQVFLETL